MARVITLMLTLALCFGGVWGCGRKAPPRLPEGERLKAQGKGTGPALGVYSPFEEEVGPVEYDEEEDVLEAAEKEPEKGSGIFQEIVGPIDKQVEEVVVPERETPVSGEGAGIMDEGLPPSPGGPEEGGF